MELRGSPQQNVLKRKSESATVPNKRIKEALPSQENGEKQFQGSEIEKISEMISEELEVLMSTFHAEKSLDSLIQDRATLKKEFAIAKENLEDPKLSNNDRRKLEEELKHLQDKIELRNAQITDQQQKILDTQKENKGKNRWDSLQSMADAKYALSYLFDMTADLKREIINKDIVCNDMKEAHDVLLKKQEENQTKFEEMTSYYKLEFSKLEREYEKKICLNYNELNEKCIHHLEIMKIFMDELQKMARLKKELTDLKKTNKALQYQVKGIVQVTSFQDAFEAFLLERRNEDKQLPAINSKLVTVNVICR